MLVHVCLRVRFKIMPPLVAVEGICFVISVLVLSFKMNVVHLNAVNFWEHCQIHVTSWCAASTNVLFYWEWWYDVAESWDYSFKVHHSRSVPVHRADLFTQYNVLSRHLFPVWAPHVDLSSSSWLVTFHMMWYTSPVFLLHFTQIKLMSLFTPTSH